MKIRVLNGGFVHVNQETGAWTVLESGDIHPVDFKSEDDIPKGVGPYEIVDTKEKPPAETDPVVANPHIAKPKKAKKPQKVSDNDPAPAEVE